MISIIMPIYNTKGEWLIQSILSCLNQTIQKFELILIDNDSNEEKTLNCLENIKNIDKIKILKCPKQPGKRGVSTALNMGIRNSKYDFIARMDSDDWMYPERLEKQLEYLNKEEDVDIVGSQMFILQQNIVTNHPEKITIETARNYDPGWFINHPTVMFRKRLFDKVGLYAEEPEIFPEDLELWTRCLLRNINIRNMSECLLNYNFHGENVSVSQGKDYEWQKNSTIIKNRIL